MIRINGEAFICRKNLRIISGANFCHVASTIHDIHEIEVITDGNQKCMGAMPSLSRIAAVNNKFNG